MAKHHLSFSSLVVYLSMLYTLTCTTLSICWIYFEVVPVSFWVPVFDVKKKSRWNLVYFNVLFLCTSTHLHSKIVMKFRFILFILNRTTSTTSSHHFSKIYFWTLLKSFKSRQPSVLLSILISRGLDRFNIPTLESEIRVSEGSENLELIGVWEKRGR